MLLRVGVFSSLTKPPGIGNTRASRTAIATKRTNRKTRSSTKVRPHDSGRSYGSDDVPLRVVGQWDRGRVPW